MKITTALVVIALVAGPAYAQRPRPHGIHGEPFVANKTFGLGLELGDLVGVNGKWFLSQDQAIDFGIGDAYGDYYVPGYGGLYLYGDYLFHPFVVTKADAFELPFYIGPGFRFINTQYCPQNECVEAFGIRVPIGLSFDFNNVPLDVFIQVTPTLDFFRDYANHNVLIDFDFTVGIRYWFT
jgi:hypothetical protein